MIISIGKYRSLVVTISVLITGCATVPEDAGFSDVQEQVNQRGGYQVRWHTGGAEDQAVEQRVNAMLREGINAEKAVHIALLNNPRLQATYEDLGVAQANLVQAGLLSNPLFHGQVTFSREEDITNFDVGVSLSFLRVFTIPLRKKLAGAEFEGAKLGVTAAVLDLAGEVREAFYRAQAAAQTQDMMEQVVESTAAALYAAQRLHDAGNITDLRLANQQALHQEARLLLVSAEMTLNQTRERLNVLMGFWGQDTQWQMAGNLSALPEQAIDTQHIENRAIERSLDLQIARQKLAAIATRLGLDTNMRLVPELDLGYVLERDDGEYEDGISLGMQIPIFDVGQARLAAGRAEFRRAQQQYLAKAIEVRSAARMARESVKIARAQTQHLEQVLLPLSQRIVNGTLLEYNAMQVGVFRLLQVQERQVELGRRYIDKLRDYWIARNQLDQILHGRMNRGDSSWSTAASAASLSAATGTGGH